MSRDVFLVSAARTPIAKFQGSLAKMSAVEIGKIAAKAAVERAGISLDAIDEVIFGNVLQAGLGQNPARQVQLGIEIPNTKAAHTTNMVCGSGLKAAMLAAQAIKAGDTEVALVGGMESMTNAPYALPKARDGYRMGHGEIRDLMIHDGLWEVYNDYHMGTTGELVAEHYKISREEMDQWSVGSHQRAAAATAEGRFQEEIVPVSIPQRKGDPIVFDKDEGVRADSSMESLARLKPVFQKDGVVTAGNSSQLSDGAAAMIVASEDAVKAHNLTPLARITGYSTSGLDPKWVMMTPVEAVKNLEAKTGLNRQSFDLFEFNEAFATQACAIPKELDLDPSKINVNGGAVALGHPIGCSGARVMVTLLHALKQRNLKTGLASLCLGGANGVAMSVELV